MGTTVAAVIMIVVILIVGGGSYFAFNSSSTTGANSNTVKSCAPAASPICAGFSGGHDVLLTEPFRVATQQAQIPFTADYLGVGTVKYYNYTFGDGSWDNTTAPIVDHTYTYPGTYLASVRASVAGTFHDDYTRLLLIQVEPGVGLADQQYIPVVAGTIVSNSSTPLAGATGLVTSGTTVTVNGTYASSPSDPSATPIAPTLTASGGSKVTSIASGASFAEGSVAFSGAGTYWVTMVGGATVGTGSSAKTYTQDYTWSIFVAPTGTNAGYVLGGTGSSRSAGSGNSGGAVYTSPHQGTIDSYHYTASPPVSEDPAIDYETLGFETIVNVYQTLIAYNGSETGITYASYVPVLATCVPGSPECQTQWGATFTGITQNGTGQNYTFVISPTARFYDPSTHASWPVYPSDVVFSLARTMAFSELPQFGSNPGWIETQSLLNAGSASWDNGIHKYFNNTPGPTFAVFGVNDSNCPAKAMVDANGCVTFHVGAGGIPWPYFLELIVDAEGSAIVPCGWFSADAQGAGIPGWTAGAFPSSDKGDHPCYLPGGATSSTQNSYTAAVDNMGPTSWDTWEKAATLSPYVGNVQWSMAGSGPYYVADQVIGSSYTLKANPAYTQPYGCTWTAGCEPKPGTYASTVYNIWETTPTQGEQEYQAGTADFATVPLTDLSFLLKLIAGGSVSLLEFPSLSIFFWPYNLNFSVSGEQSTYIPNVNVPANWFSYVGMRQFFSHAYPYASTENTIGTLSGIQFYENYGGAIPRNMANYYQGNISWPAGDPNGSSSTPGTAAWWWSQSITPSSPYYDPEAASCTSSSPCIVSMIGEAGAPDFDERIADWQKQVDTLSGGAIELLTADTSFNTLVVDSTQDAPGTMPLPVYNLGWAPDYPDPTDYVTPMYLPDSTYTAADAVNEQLTSATFDSGTCHSSSDYAYWAAQANANGSIQNNCQGAAYKAMTAALLLAATDTDSASRLILYWQAESIANGLSLYVYVGQQNEVYSYASWLNGTSINDNVTIGGGTVQTWWSLTGNGVAG